MSKNYLVTGGSGYFGEILVKKLLSLNNKVRVIDINNLSFTHDNLEFIYCDISKIKKEDEKKIFSNIDIIHHNAAVLPIENDKKRFWDVNSIGTNNVINLAISYNIKKFIYVSSASIFAKSKIIEIDEKTTPNPIENYGASKLDGENLLVNYKNKIDIVIIRPRTVVGNGRYGLFQIIFEWTFKGYKIPLLNKGKNIFQFIHCDDLVEFCLLAETLKGYEIFNIGTDKICSIKDIIEGLIKHANSKSKVIYFPNIASSIIELTSKFKLSPINKWHISAMTKDQYFNTQKAKDLLGWVPKYGNIEMICESYDHYTKDRTKILKQNTGSVHKKKLKKGILKILEFFLKF
tara:strand:+ start:340 stop:1380 length:1041 start_codon:yes stop_codon:yes gene_type:complete